MTEKDTNGNNSAVKHCPCQTFASIHAISVALGSEERTRALIEWLSAEPPEQGLFLSCQQPNRSKLRCTNRVKTSFSILDAIREDCRELLASASTLNPVAVAPAKRLATKGPPPDVLSYDESFPSLSTSTQSTPNILLGRRKPIKKSVAPQVSNQLQKQKRRMKPSPATHKSPLGNIEMLPSEDPISLRPVNEVWKASIALKASQTSIVVSELVSAPTPPSTIWGATAAPSKHNTIPIQELQLSETTSPFPQTISVQLSDMPILKENLGRLARLYVSLMLNLLVPSTSMELHLLVRLLAVSDSKVVPTMDLKENTGSLKHLFVSPSACRFFAISVFYAITPLVYNLPSEIVTALIECPPFRENMPDLIAALTAARSAKVNEDLAGTPHSTPMLSLPFVQQRDSRHNYKTKEELAMFKNREESRDAFLHQLRFFQNTRGKILDTSELNASVQKVKVASKNVIQSIHKLNMNWFADFFCELLLQIGLVPMEETDAELLSISDTDKIQKLHKRFSSNVGARKSNGKVNYGQNEDDGSASPIFEAEQRFLGHQEFFFLFIQATDSYSFVIHLKSRLATLIAGLSTSFSPKGVSAKLMKLQLLSRFLGFIVFAPNWGVGCENVVLSPDETKSWIATTEPCLPILAMIRSSWVNRQVVTVVPWVVEYLRMAKWDKVSLHRSPSLHSILATLRTIQLKCQSEWGSPNALSVSNFLEVLFGDVYGLGRTSFLPLVELPSPGEKATDSDSLDMIPISFNSELLFTSNPYLDELLSLITSLSQTPKQSSGASRKLRPSMVSPGKKSMYSEDDAGTEISNLDFSISSISINNISTHASANDSTYAISRKLVDVFFHQHRELKDTCEFVVDRAAKNALSITLQQFIVPRLKKALYFEANFPSHLLSQLVNQTVKASRGSIEKLLDGTIRGSLDHLISVGTPEGVMNMAASLCIAHGLKLVESMLANNAIVEAKKLFDDCLRERKKLKNTVPHNLERERLL